LITSYDTLLTALELSIRKTAQPHDPPTLYLLHTVPGSGTILRLVWLYAIHPIDRFASVQAFASYARLLTGSKASGGHRLGTAGKKIGNAHLKGAFAEAAPLFLRHTPQGQNLLARWETKHDTGKALRMLAHQRGRAVSVMLKRQGAVDLARFLQTSGRRAGEPGASLDAAGMSLSRACATPAPAASVHAQARRGRPRRGTPDPSGLLGPPRWLRKRRRGAPPVPWAAPPPSPARPGESPRLSQAFAGDGMRARHDF